MNLHRGDSLPAFGEGLLDGNVEVCAVRLGAYSLDIAAQIDDGVVHAFFFKILFYPVCNVAFGDGSNVDGSLGICQHHGVVLKDDILIIHMAAGRGASFGGRDLGIFPMEIPQLGHGADGDIESSVSHL